MKKIVVLILIIISNIAYSEINPSSFINSKNSAHLNAFIYELDSKSLNNVLAEESIPVFINGDSKKIDAFLKTKTENYSILTNEFISARLNLELINQLNNLSYVNRITLSSPGGITDDNQKQMMGVDQVHSGSQGIYPYKGKGVLVGVIDTGIDFYHREFKETKDSNKTRILYIWDQTGLKTTHPDGFNYGNEWTKYQLDGQISGEKEYFITENDSARGHGTHVSGIAAGKSGIAPEANIIFVKMSMAYTTDLDRTTFELRLADAIKYVFKKADELNMPCVINTSLGVYHHIRDGNEPLGKIIDALITEKPGRAFVASAGNSGQVPYHIGRTLKNGDSIDITTPNSINELNICAVPKVHLNELYYSLSIDSGVKRIGYTKWYKASDLLQIGVKKDSIFDLYTKEYRGTATFSMSDHSDLFTYLTIGKSIVSNKYVPKVRIKGNGYFHCWDYSMGYGDIYYNIGCPATGKNVVCVASSQARTDPNNGVMGEISKFSSFGPTSDERNKPDVTAPGGNIISARAKGYSVQSGIGEYRDYIQMSGTSMSSPAVAGLVAMMLEKNPKLTSTEICEILRNTSRKVYKTITKWPDRQLGYGFIDAVSIFGTTGIEEIFSSEASISPNPAMDYITINVGAGSKPALVDKIEIFNIFGEKVEQTFLSVQIGQTGMSDPLKIDVSNLAAGVYFIKIGDKFEKFIKI